jgi:X-X-X-Leu-X-X-Gly heptad repeat protein
MAQDSLDLLQRGLPQLKSGLQRLRDATPKLSAKLQARVAAHFQDLINLIVSYRS